MSYYYYSSLFWLTVIKTQDFWSFLKILQRRDHSLFFRLYIYTNIYQQKKKNIFFRRNFFLLILNTLLTLHILQYKRKKSTVSSFLISKERSYFNNQTFYSLVKLLYHVNIKSLFFVSPLFFWLFVDSFIYHTSFFSRLSIDIFPIYLSLTKSLRPTFQKESKTHFSLLFYDTTFYIKIHIFNLCVIL